LDTPSFAVTEGRIVFKHVDLKYTPDGPLVLKGLDFTIAPGQKVGIVGRTGAGKSSTFGALFRMAEVSGGCIKIDGQDIAEQKLYDLRSAMCGSCGDRGRYSLRAKPLSRRTQPPLHRPYE
jgi:ATP-binding cassette subfamily C (CFTR/MRP) protein 1